MSPFGRRPKVTSGSINVSDAASLLPFVRLEELYDHLLERLGFDSAHPGWSPALRDLHKRSRSRRLQVIPEFFYTPVVSPEHVPDAQWQAVTGEPFSATQARAATPWSGYFDRDGVWID